MGITAITIENFKGIKEPVRVELKPITLLFGPNSAGKSTIVQALHYAREIFERQNLNPDKTLLGGDSIDLGGFRSFVHNHNKDLPIRLEVELDPNNEEWPEYIEDRPYVNDSELDSHGSAYLWESTNYRKSISVLVEIKWSNHLEKPYIAQYVVRNNGDHLLTIESSPDGRRVQLTEINPFNPVFLGNVDPVEAKKKVGSFFAAAAKGEPSDSFWGVFSDNSESFGTILPALFQFMKLEHGVPGINVPIELAGQSSALPRWGKVLGLDKSIFDNNIEAEELFNFIRVLSSHVVGPGELVREGLRKLCYIGPMREVPKRNHVPSTSPDKSRWANGLAAYDILHYADHNLIDRVNQWLAQKDRLNSGYSVAVKRYKELDLESNLILSVMQDRLLDEDLDFSKELENIPEKRRLIILEEESGLEVLPQDIGVGVSQVLPVVVAALNTNKGFVVIEQPELHIHPAFQVALGDLFIEQVRQYPDLIFILETHSEHLMLRFLRRIRETGENEAPENRTLTPAELSIYFIEQGEAGISCLPIRVDEDGDFIDRWPHGFFDERAEELF